MKPKGSFPRVQESQFRGPG